MGGGRGKHGKENPRRFYVVGLRTEPAPIVRGSSRRITIMRFRPANIRVINRRKNYLDHNPRCLPRVRKRKKKQLLVVDRSFHIRTYQELLMLAWPGPKPSLRTVDSPLDLNVASPDKLSIRRSQKHCLRTIDSKLCACEYRYPVSGLQSFLPAMSSTCGKGGRS